MQEQTTISDVLAHVQTLETQLQTELDALFVRNRILNWSGDAYRQNEFAIRETSGQLLGVTKVIGYLQGRISVDAINAQYPLSLQTVNANVPAEDWPTSI